MKRSVKLFVCGGQLIQYKFRRVVDGAERYFNITFPRQDLCNRRSSMALEIKETRKYYRALMDRP